MSSSTLTFWVSRLKVRSSMNFSIAPGTMTALSGRNDNRAYFLLSGDLNQMGRMESILREMKFPVVKWDVYPGFLQNDEEKYIEALKLIYSWGIEGWWNQESALIKYKICTQEEFDAKLGRKPRA
jgi:hypothetical protein